MNNWPNDEDGDVFRQIEEHGFDFESEHQIDFNIDFETWPLTEEVRNQVIDLYPDAEFVEPDEDDIEMGEDKGYVQVSVVAKLSYQLVVEKQKQLSAEVKSLGGWCDSWGVSCG